VAAHPQDAWRGGSTGTEDQATGSDAVGPLSRQLVNKDKM